MIIPVLPTSLLKHIFTKFEKWHFIFTSELIDQFEKDAESVLIIDRGEVVTVRVQTHEDGAYLFWEFATDSYDLGFGVYFEWSDVKTNQVRVLIQN